MGLRAAIESWCRQREDFVENALSFISLEELRVVANEELPFFSGRYYLGEMVKKEAETGQDPFFIREALVGAEPFVKLMRPALESLPPEARAVAIYNAPHEGLTKNVFVNVEPQGLSRSYFEIVGQKLRNRPKESLFFRSGFFKTEYDVLESVVLGFDGIFIYVGDMDYHYLQLLGEVCREYRLSTILVVDSEKSLTIALNTDIPYFCVPAFSTKDEKNDFVLTAKIFQKIPKTCLLLSWLAEMKQEDIPLLKSFHVSVAVS